MRLCGDFLLRCTLFCHSVATFLTSVSSYEGGCGFEVEETFGTPYDDDDSEIPAHQKEEYSKAGVPFGKHIQGNLGQTLVPDKRLASGKSSTNSHVQVIINKNGTLNHRTVGIAHEFGHVILYLRNVPFSHGQPGVNNFIYNKRADVMSKRLGYDY